MIKFDLLTSTEYMHLFGALRGSFTLILSDFFLGPTLIVVSHFDALTEIKRKQYTFKNI